MGSVAREDTVEDALDRIAAAWGTGDAVAYAREFTEDASYVIYIGQAYRGRAEIERAHVPVFAKWQKGSRMGYRVVDVRPVGRDAAVVLTEGGVGRPGRVRLDKVQTYAMVRGADGRWRCAAFQNTRKNRLLLRLTGLFERR
ncbi:SgcJ/EcaC family oxidoreductase [Streptomyces avicenniae]|uniref:SgcJ/EcaC family oxidoreductase n=1 Tax=Streptomyces avicenniae TaxID=500153 RepID=UPI00069B0217|nr:SgcJ/EcaC family oxidoreductase [Streptomyces avicenniae]